MKNANPVFSTLLIMLLMCPSYAQVDSSSAFERVKWINGPERVSLGAIAEISVQNGHIFANGSDTRLLMEEMQNPSNGSELGFLAPASMDWYVVFEFDEVGYIRDDEKNALDEDAMLKQIIESSKYANQERERRGWPPLNILGWEQTPRYNENTNNLEWAIRGESEGTPVINWNTRLLGRGGVMRVTLVAEPYNIRSFLPQFYSCISSFSFKAGQRYQEFREGDKAADYGLTALIAGGATAVAVKSGAAKWIWKLLVVIVVGIAGFFKKIFSGK